MKDNPWKSNQDLNSWEKDEFQSFAAGSAENADLHLVHDFYDFNINNSQDNKSETNEEIIV